MLDFISLVKRRRSMRKFTPGLLDTADLNLILKAALMSPSSKGLHSWEFVLVTEPDVLRELAKCKTQGAEFLAEAPEAVVVLGDPAVSDVWIEDASVASTMMLLQAEEFATDNRAVPFFKSLRERLNLLILLRLPRRILWIFVPVDHAERHAQTGKRPADLAQAPDPAPKGRRDLRRRRAIETR